MGIFNFREGRCRETKGEKVEKALGLVPGSTHLDAFLALIERLERAESALEELRAQRVE